MDLRIPVALMFLLLGMLLAGYGLASDPSAMELRLGFRVNVVWGAVMMVFGAAMWLSAFLGRRTAARESKRGSHSGLQAAPAPADDGRVPATEPARRV
jgi:hypothetical protein